MAICAMYTQLELSIAWLHVFLLIYSNILSLCYYLLSSMCIHVLHRCERDFYLYFFLLRRLSALSTVSECVFEVLLLPRWWRRDHRLLLHSATSHFLIHHARPIIIPLNWRCCVPCHRCCSTLLARTSIYIFHTVNVVHSKRAQRRKKGKNSQMVGREQCESIAWLHNKISIIVTIRSFSRAWANARTQHQTILN